MFAVAAELNLILNNILPESPGTPTGLKFWFSLGSELICVHVMLVKYFMIGFEITLCLICVSSVALW